MKDRFCFRFGITLQHYDEEGEDIETSIICETEAVFDSGSVGVDLDTLENVIKSLHLSEERERTLWNALYEYELCEDWFVFDPDFIEQCTGRKDMNGKLIYEGDLVMVDGYIDKYKVIWDEERCCFAIDHLSKILPLGASSFASVAIPMIIIGNIHDKKDEK